MDDWNDSGIYFVALQKQDQDFKGTLVSSLLYNSTSRESKTVFLSFLVVQTNSSNIKHECKTSFENWIISNGKSLI